MVDSKEAKANIQTDVASVQRPGKTWHKVNLPYHDWSKSNQTSIIPMMHLFLDTYVALQANGDDVDVYSVKRTVKSCYNFEYFFFWATNSAASI